MLVDLKGRQWDEEQEGYLPAPLGATSQRSRHSLSIGDYTSSPSKSKLQNPGFEPTYRFFSGRPGLGAVSFSLLTSGLFTLAGFYGVQEVACNP